MSDRIIPVTLTHPQWEALRDAVRAQRRAFEVNGVARSLTLERAYAVLITAEEESRPGPSAAPAEVPVTIARVEDGPELDVTDRDEFIRFMRGALRRRTGLTWSVTGGKGTAWGWVTVHVPPRLRDVHDYMPENRADALAQALGLDRAVHGQGLVISPKRADRIEYAARAAGKHLEQAEATGA